MLYCGLRRGELIALAWNDINFKNNTVEAMFRHTYATILYNAGADVKSAQRFMGHADIKVTLKIYTHLPAQKEQEAIDALNRHLGKNASEKNLMQ